MLHYIHPGHAIGDVHPYQHGGTLYLYYLKPGGKYEAALLLTEDLLNWREAEVIHEPDGEPGLFPPLKPYFVLNVLADGESGLYRSYFGSQNVMRGSVSTDLRHWRAAGEAFNVPAQEAYAVQRDPFLLYIEEEGQYWMVMTARKSGGQNGPHGGLAYVSSPDLRNWTARGDLYFPGDIGDPECPEMFRLNDKWYLLFSVYDHAVGGPVCLMADSPSGPWHDLPRSCLDGDDLAAAQTIPYGDGRLMFGWIPLQDKETLGSQYWGGHLAFPREIYQQPDGALCSRLERTVGERIRGGELWRIRSDVSPPAAWTRLDTDIVIEWPADCERMELRITGRDGARPATVIALDRGGCRLSVSTGDMLHSSLPVRSFEAATALRLIVEEDIVEVFVDDRYSLAARLSAKPGVFGVEAVEVVVSAASTGMRNEQSAISSGSVAEWTMYDLLTAHDVQGQGAALG